MTLLWKTKNEKINDSRKEYISIQWYPAGFYPTFLFTSWKVTNEHSLMFEQTVWIKYLLTYLHVYSIIQTFKL